MNLYQEIAFCKYLIVTFTSHINDDKFTLHFFRRRMWEVKKVIL
jgi:hypothetical protein